MPRTAPGGRTILANNWDRAALWNKLCTIQTAHGVRDATGQKTDAPQPLAGHANLPCRKASGLRGGQGEFEVERGLGTITVTPEAIWLSGYFPNITMQHLAVVDGVTYDIEGVAHTSDGQFTRLAVQVQE